MVNQRSTRTHHKYLTLLSLILHSNVDDSAHTDPLESIFPKRTLVLICGYARAGKDTLGSGILEWCEKNAEKINFADALKDTANVFLDCLELKGDFHNEDFKQENRQALVALGTFARALKPSVFADIMAQTVAQGYDDDGMPLDTVVCTDWRYLNELIVCQQLLIPLGWRVRTVYISTSGVSAANTEEANSICEIRDIVRFDQEYHFDSDQRQKIMHEGRMLAKQWSL
jgi:hypothetical protein